MASDKKNNTSHRSIPIPTLRRLPLYHHFLMNLQGVNEAYVSCTTIADALGLIPVQVRKDLAVTGITGKPKVGYLVGELIQAIEHFLHWDDTAQAFLVGVGNLGSALLGFKGFKEYGMAIAAAFDIHPHIVGSKVCGTRVMPLSDFPIMAARMNVRIGIITVPAAAAQDVASLMVDVGIKAIWNFAPAPLQVTDDVCVENEDLASSLAVLSQQLQYRMA